MFFTFIFKKVSEWIYELLKLITIYERIWLQNKFVTKNLVLIFWREISPLDDGNLVVTYQIQKS